MRGDSALTISVLRAHSLPSLHTHLLVRHLVRHRPGFVSRALSSRLQLLLPRLLDVALRLVGLRNIVPHPLPGLALDFLQLPLCLRLAFLQLPLCLRLRHQASDHESGFMGWVESREREL